MVAGAGHQTPKCPWSMELYLSLIAFHCYPCVYFSRRCVFYIIEICTQLIKNHIRPEDGENQLLSLLKLSVNNILERSGNR